MKVRFPGFEKEDNLVGWVQEEYYDDIYGDLFQKEENGYFNNWLENNNVDEKRRRMIQNQKADEEVQKRLLREKKLQMQKAMDKLFPVET